MGYGFRRRARADLIAPRRNDAAKQGRLSRRSKQPSPVPSPLGSAMFGAWRRLCSISDRSGSCSSSFGAIGLPRYATQRHTAFSLTTSRSIVAGDTLERAGFNASPRVPEQSHDQRVHETQLADHRWRDHDRVAHGSKREAFDEIADAVRKTGIGIGSVALGPRRTRQWIGPIVSVTCRGIDEYLRHLRFGQDCAESTTKAYAESLARIAVVRAVERLGAFNPETLSVGPGLPAVRGPAKSIGSWLRYVDSSGTVSRSVMRRWRCWQCCLRSATTDICRSRPGVRTSWGIIWSVLDTGCPNRRFESIVPRTRGVRVPRRLSVGHHVTGLLHREVSRPGRMATTRSHGRGCGVARCAGYARGHAFVADASGRAGWIQLSVDADPFVMTHQERDFVLAVVEQLWIVDLAAATKPADRRHLSGSRRTPRNPAKRPDRGYRRSAGALRRRAVGACGGSRGRSAGDMGPEPSDSASGCGCLSMASPPNAARGALVLCL